MKPVSREVISAQIYSVLRRIAQADPAAAAEILATIDVSQKRVLSSSSLVGAHCALLDLIGKGCFRFFQEVV